MSDIDIEGRIDTGLSVSRGREKLRVALVDDQGRVVADGPEVAKCLFDAACRAYEAFWLGNGTLKALNPS